MTLKNYDNILNAWTPIFVKTMISWFVYSINQNYQMLPKVYGLPCSYLDVLILSLPKCIHY